MTIPELVNLNFKIVVPQAATNLVTNPSLETNTTGYTAVGGATLTRSATHQRRGAWALRITPVASTESGAYFGTVSVTSGIAYVFSVDVLGVLGQDYKLQLKNTTGTLRKALTFTGTGYWQRLEVTFTATATESWRLYVVRDSGETGTDYFYIDGLQFETGSTATTYFDGDSIGFVRGQKDFGWNGTRHGSTSYRTAKTRAGGSLLDMSDYCTLAGVMGLGMGSFSQHYTNIITGGAIYEGHTRKPRNFSLLLHYTGSMSEMWDDKNAILDAIRPDYTGIFQPMVLRFQGTDASGNEATEPLDIVCIPQVSHTDPPQTPALQEDILSFTALDSILPGAYQEGAQLDFADSLTNANCVLFRDNDKIWKEMDAGIGYTINVLAIAPNGDVYAAGGSGATYILYKWDGSSWSSIDTPTGVIHALVFDSQGNLYIGGSFSNWGDANGDGIVKWDGSSISSLSTGLGIDVYALAIDSNDNLYAGGSFTGAGNRIAKWDGSSWSALGAGLNNTVYSIAIDVLDNVYVGGAFTTAGGNSANYTAKWDGSSWSPMSTGMNAAVYVMKYSQDGYIYAGGYFTTAGGNSIQRIAKWNGFSWEPLLGISTISGLGIRDIAIDKDGRIYIAGAISSVSGIAVYGGFFIWNNGSIEIPNISLPSAPSTPVYAVEVDSQNRVYITYPAFGTATTSGNTTITNGGGANCYPKVRINGPGRLHKLINNTTGAQITFASLTLLTGEILTINFEPGNISAESTYRGNCLSYIAPGSDLADFFLRKGSNSISFLMTGTDGDTSAEMIWTPTFGNIEGSRYA